MFPSVGEPPGSGKKFVIKLIKHTDVMFAEIPHATSCHYGEFQQWMQNTEYSTIIFIEDLPDMALLDQTEVSFLIFDDIMHEMNEVGAKLLTKGMHTSVILLTQNIFH